ncbi:MAG: DUF3467 domain-containing protein [Anaerolineales bacterium]
MTVSKKPDTPIKPPGPQRKVQIEYPPNIDGTYANLALITHSASEIVLDFARVLPNTPKARIQARVVMTPMNAKLLHRALGENLSKFEGQYGEIKIPEGGSLADQLFRPPDDKGPPQ